jgi:ATP-dependent RNA helicase RhlE
MSDFKSLNLLPSILKALTSKGYTHPTPIQAKAIPHVLQGKDLLGIAQTGTGKTAAFSLPLLQHIATNKVKMRPRAVRSLILTPTRELATQIEDNVKLYGKGLNLFSTVIFGGVGKSPQIRALNKGIDILIATPGRLLDLMNEGYISFHQLDVFILDEADRMLDMGFIRDIRKIILKLPKKKQTLLFSATMPNDIASLATSLLNKPIRVEVTPQASTVEKITQTINFVEKSNKPLLLKSILADKSIKSALVFSRTKHGADRIVKRLLADEISAAAIHGNKSQNNREKALNGFRSQEIRVLVATDIAARGIDVSHVSHVFNYDLPNDPESYVHRIGRTARAGREGIAIAFCDPDEEKLLKEIEKFIREKIPVDNDHPFFGVAPAPKADRNEFRREPRKNTETKSSERKSGDRDNKYKKKRKPTLKSKNKVTEGDKKSARDTAKSNFKKKKNYKPKANKSFKSDK